MVECKYLKISQVWLYLANDIFQHIPFCFRYEKKYKIFSSAKTHRYDLPMHSTMNKILSAYLLQLRISAMLAVSMRMEASFPERIFHFWSFLALAATWAVNPQKQQRKITLDEGLTWLMH